MAVVSDTIEVIETVVPSRLVEVRDGYVYVQDPKMILTKDELKKIEDASDYVFQFRRSPENVIIEFVDLEEGDDDRLAQFVRRFGLLGLCQHGKPHNHLPGCGAERVSWIEGEEDTPSLWKAPRSRTEVGIRERVEAWYHYRDRAEALLTIAVFLRGKVDARRGRVRGAWRTLIDDGGADQYPTIPTLMRNRVAAITMHSENLNDWLQTAALALSQAWDPNEERGRTELTGTLLGNLGYQILAATNGSTLLAYCDNCARLFEPNPRVPEDRGKYCKLCRSKNVSGRVRQQRFRERQQEIRRLNADGVPIREIATRMDAKPEKIRKWLGVKR